SVQGGEVQKFTQENFPKDDTSFVWIDTRVKKNKVPLKKFEPTVSSIQGLDNLEITATVTDQTGEMIGTYLPNYNTGKLVAALDPGQVYEITIEAPGFQTVKQKVNVMALGDYRKVIKKSFTLVEDGLEVPNK
ncbi:MAG: hypothetical protein QF371_04465, partial [Flavobacteriales bacterium]|nr:hypothetical protein [Flavobacteriales bacterium]